MQHIVNAHGTHRSRWTVLRVDAQMKTATDGPKTAKTDRGKTLFEHQTLHLDATLLQYKRSLTSIECPFWLTAVHHGYIPPRPRA